MKLTEWVLKNPKSFWAVLAVFLVLAGVALIVTPMRMMPSLESPILGVVTRSEGNPATIEEQITIPIEETVKDLSHIRTVKAASTMNTSLVLIQYEWGTDMQQAKSLLLTKVSEFENKLKVSHEKPVVITVDPLNLPVVVYGFTGTGTLNTGTGSLGTGSGSLDKLRKDVEKLADSIRIGSGLSSSENRGIRAALVGGGKFSLSELSNVFISGKIDYQAETVNFSEGVDEQSIDEESGTGSMLVEASSSDMAVEKDMEMFSGYTFDGKEGVELAIYGEQNADSRDIIQKVAEKIENFKAKNLNYEVTKVYDNSHFISLLAENMEDELLISIILAALMLLIFLQSARAMWIVLITIPISLAGAFVIFPLFNMSLNSSTLVGLLLAIGRLVDDSIVVIHAVHRHIKAGMSKVEAAITGVKEVYLAILSATVIMMLAVLPLAFAPGLTGIMFVGIAVPILAALAVSFFVSVTLTPLLAVTFFKHGIKEGSRWNPLTWFYRLAEFLLHGLEIGYGKVLQFCLKNRFLALFIAILIAGSGFNLWQKIGSEMMPLSDTAQISLMYDFKAEIFPEDRIKQSLAIEKLFLTQPEVAHISSELGMVSDSFIAVNGFNPMMENSVSALVTLKDKGERQTSIWDVIDRLAPELQKNPAIAKVTMKEMGADVMATAGAPAEIVFSAQNRTFLQFFAKEAFAKAQGIDDLKLPHATGIDNQMLLWRENFKPSVIIGGFYRQGKTPSMQLVGKMWGEAERLKQDVLKRSNITDYSTVTITGRGDMVEMMDATNIMVKNLLIAAILIFFTLIIFFRSFSLPFIIFLAIPLELTGVLGALYLMQQTFSTVSILGIIVLNGIDVATAILLIDFLQNYKAKTKVARNKHIISAATIRLRPVLMTVLITILVLIPLAFYPKAGIDAFSPLATVILGGLTMSSVLVLIVVPTLFTIFDDFRMRKKSKLITTN
ncbi:MAG: hypothetical protein A2V81_05125 [Candidatus Abawacabacteria bacterium RBG_16_42_10]|uniref:SSD domain-containing protein n=1 Tax=Candidatus Abawacabacteria bacterium RBG_16_42_10 TaxID=1817814 RepID=A0A1F4XKK9_9BACT|nr:MAG: hypothetical protein A2V81_05125 [Candidatus Abawacabacteria bacterium RBG_16_42_10]